MPLPRNLPRPELERMRAAGDEVLECQRVLAKTADNVVGEVLRGADGFFEWNHYPTGDAYDAETHAQYYYHAHPKAARVLGEHGHFHTFLRPRGMPAGIRPAPVPDLAPEEDGNARLSHLVAVSMDPRGHPFRLFTTNRWVTGETWYAAGDVIRMLDRFAIDQARPSWPTNRWLTAMLRLFRPQIVELLHARDAAVRDWAARHPDVNVFEDRRLEVTSECRIAVPDQIEAVRRALDITAAAPPRA